MVFSSAVFLCAFLPLVFLLNRLTPGIRGKNILLIIASLVFYAFGNLAYIFLLLASVTCNYFAGLFAGSKGKTGRTALLLAVAVNLGLLGVFKYLGFLMRNLELVFPALQSLGVPDIVLPVGISFFTFQGLSYVIDVYNDPKLCSRNFLDVLLYISLFPQLVAGPIVKYRDVAKEIHSRVCTPNDTTEGVRRFIVGLSKKLLIADVAGEAVTTVYSLAPLQLDFRLAWLGAIAYTLQIYFDFSGYSDMAIGLGRIFGFHFKENFRYPYASGSIKEFWRRWHISLSSWFRDYLYIPLGGSRKGMTRTYVNKLIVFFCTGLWHGADWTFIAWGLWHGFFLIMEDSLLPGPERRKSFCTLGHIYTMLIVILGFMLFRAEDMGQAGVMLSNMFFGFRITPESSAALAKISDPLHMFTLAAGCVHCLPLLPYIREKMGNPRVDWSYPAVLLLFVADLLHLSAASYVPFIYFQF